MTSNHDTLHIDALIALTLEILKMKPDSVAQQNALKFLQEQRERILRS